jgi:hypothetical protein
MYVTTGLGLFWITLGLLASVVERYRPRAAPVAGNGQRLTQVDRA